MSMGWLGDLESTVVRLAFSASPLLVQNVSLLDESCELSSIMVGLMLSAPSSALCVTELDASQCSETITINPIVDLISQPYTKQTDKQSEPVKCCRLVISLTMVAQPR